MFLASILFLSLSALTAKMLSSNPNIQNSTQNYIYGNAMDLTDLTCRIYIVIVLLKIEWTAQLFTG